MSTANAVQLQHEVLAEYARMAHNLDAVCPRPPRLSRAAPLTLPRGPLQMAKLSQKLAGAQPYILEQLRPLERKMGLVLTLYQGPSPRLAPCSCRPQPDATSSQRACGRSSCSDRSRRTTSSTRDDDAST